MLHGQLPALYRAWRQQARWLAYQWRDPYLYEAHSYLARRAVDQLRFDTRSPHTARRHAQCERRIDQLAWANAGWPTAVRRALEQAYARRGPLWHQHLQPMAPPHPSPPVGDNARYPKRLRLPVISPVLRAWLLDPAAYRGQQAPRPSALACPPKLAIARESAAKIPGHTVSRRRTANAHWRWLQAQWAKLHAPIGVALVPPSPSVERGLRAQIMEWNQHASRLFLQAEAHAKSRGATKPRRARKSRRAEADAPSASAPAYLASAQAHVAHLVRTRGAQYQRSVREKPIDYMHRTRARRREWQRLLAQAPLLEWKGKEPDLQTVIGARPASALAAVAQGLHSPLPKDTAPPKQVRARLSPHAMYGGKGPRSVLARATPEEVAWVRHGATVARAAPAPPAPAST